MFLFCADLFNVVSVLCAFCCLYCNMYFVFVSFCIFLMLIYGLFSSFPVSRAGKTNSIAGKIYNLTIVRFLPYIPKQAQVRIRFMSFLSVTWGVRCRFHLVRAVQRPGYAIFRGFHALLGKPDKVFFTFGGRKRKRGDTSGIVHSIGEKTVLHICSTPKRGGAAKMQR